MDQRLQPALAGTVGVLALGAVCVGASITGIEVFNTSSPDPVPTNRTFLTESFVSPVSAEGATLEFTHRLAAFNEHTAMGTVAQTNKGNVVFQLDFTVQDPSGVGFTLDLEGVIRSVSFLNLLSNPGGSAFASGLTLGAEWNDSTMPAGVYENLPVPVFGQGTAGTGLVQAPGLYFDAQQSIAEASLGQYVGTTAFSFRFTSVITPTTNVLFPNGATGTGSVNLGLGPLPGGIGGIDVDTLGHFFTVRATFVPGTGGAALVAMVGVLAARRRRGQRAGDR